MLHYGLKKVTVNGCSISIDPIHDCQLSGWQSNSHVGTKVWEGIGQKRGLVPLTQTETATDIEHNESTFFAVNDLNNALPYRIRLHSTYLFAVNRTDGPKLGGGADVPTFTCWRSGSVVRTSVFRWRTFPDLHPIDG